jgi:predicted RND superfamily exporter protein
VSAIIFILCALVLRSLVGGLFVLTPLAIAVIVNLGLMGWTGIWLDMSTAAITAMGISIGADFAIYHLYRIREEQQTANSLEAAIRASLRTSGKAIFYVSSAVAIGYLVLPFSGFSIWIRLGVLTALMVCVSALTTLAVLPALAMVGRPVFLRRAVGTQPASAESMRSVESAAR